MAQLPLRLPQDQMETRWASLLNPVLSNVFVQGQLLTGIDLIAGDNVINHKLSRKMVGFAIVDIDAPAITYRSQPFNDKTLTLTSDAITTINLWVF